MSANHSQHNLSPHMRSPSPSLDSASSSSDSSSLDPSTPLMLTSPLDSRRGSSQSTSSSDSSSLLGWQPSNQHHHHHHHHSDNSTKSLHEIQGLVTPPWSPERRLSALSAEPPADGASLYTHSIDQLEDRSPPVQHGPPSSSSLWQSQGLYTTATFTAGTAPSALVDEDSDDSKSETDSDIIFSVRSSLDSRTSLEDQGQGTPDQDILSPYPPICIISGPSSLASSAFSSPLSPPSLPSNSRPVHLPRSVYPPRPPTLSSAPPFSGRLTHALSNPLLHDDVLPKDNLTLSALSLFNPSFLRNYYSQQSHHRLRRSYHSSSSHTVPGLPLALKLVHTVLHIFIPCLTFFILGSIALWAAGTVYYYLGLWVFGFWSDAYKRCFWVMVGLASLGFAYYGFWLVIKIGSGLAETWGVDLFALDDLHWVNSFSTIDPRSIDPHRERDLELGLSRRIRNMSAGMTRSLELDRIE